MSEFNYSTKKSTWPDFGDYVMIEQKRFGVPNEMFMHKVIGRLGSNMYFDIPAATHLGMKHAGEVVDVVRVICCGIDETKVLTFRVEDVRPCDWMRATPAAPVAAPALSDWQPIATAPKDQRCIVWNGQERYAAHWGQNPFTDDEAWIVAGWGSDGDQLLVKPTHWMPLPAAPKESA